MGRIAQINRGDGGVPKHPVDEAEIGPEGLLDDTQAEYPHHGGTEKAVSLLAREVIDALRAEGHPIEAGSTGENLTVEGIDWTCLGPGARLRAGDVLLEIVSYATPCKKQTRWFSDGDFTRILHSKHPGQSRLYARVIQTGRVRTGDPIALVEP